ncbi:19938_t:CDS:2 [Cetraspora pellucida]|uniref:19938_t:CDS:1 n=1 Tax=Cetraspora pellucida TaxID=1433469 RepID=A0A9N9AKC4_9GLOM|nr:19938_t:CDS:2 [Cetraspora pellucida]
MTINRSEYEDNNKLKNKKNMPHLSPGGTQNRNSWWCTFGYKEPVPESQDLSEEICISIL